MTGRPPVLENIDQDSPEEAGFGTIELKELQEAIESGKLERQEELDQLEQELLLPQYKMLAKTFTQQLAYEKYASQYQISSLTPDEQQHVQRLWQIIDRQYEQFDYNASLDLHLLAEQAHLSVLEKVVTQKMRKLKQHLDDVTLFDKVRASIKDGLSQQIDGNPVPENLLEITQLEGKAQTIFKELFISYTGDTTQGTAQMPGLYERMVETKRGIDALIETKEGQEWTDMNQLWTNYFRHLNIENQQDFLRAVITRFPTQEVRMMDQSLVDRLRLWYENIDIHDPDYPLLAAALGKAETNTQERVNNYNEVRASLGEATIRSQHHHGGLTAFQDITVHDWNRFFPNDPIRPTIRSPREGGLRYEAEKIKKSNLQHIKLCDIGKFDQQLMSIRQISDIWPIELAPGERLCIQDSTANPVPTDEHGILQLTRDHLVITRENKDGLIERRHLGEEKRQGKEIPPDAAKHQAELEQLTLEQLRHHPAMEAFGRIGNILNENLIPLAQLTSGQVTEEMLETIQAKVHEFMQDSWLDLMRSAREIDTHLQDLEQIDFATLSSPAAQEMRAYIMQMRTMRDFILPESGASYRSSQLYHTLDSLKEARANTIEDRFKKDGLPLLGAVIVAVGAILASAPSGGAAPTTFVAAMARHTVGRAAITTIAGSMGFRATRMLIGSIDESAKIKTDIEKVYTGQISTAEFFKGLSLEIALGTATMSAFLKAGQLFGRRVELNPDHAVAKYLKEMHPNFRQSLTPQLARTQRSFFRQYIQEVGKETTQETAEMVAAEINPLFGVVTTIFNCLSPGGKPMRINSVEGNTIDVSMIGIKPTRQHITNLTEKGFIQRPDGTLALKLGTKELIVRLEGNPEQNNQQPSTTEKLYQIDTKAEDLTRLNSSLDQLIQMIDQVKGDQQLEEALVRKSSKLGLSALLSKMSSRVKEKFTQLSRLIQQKFEHISENYEIVSLMTGEPFQATANFGLFDIPIFRRVRKLQNRGPFEALKNSTTLQEFVANYENGYTGIDGETVTQQELQEGINLLTDLALKGARKEYLYFIAITKLKITDKKLFTKVYELIEEHKKQEFKKLPKDARKELKSHNRRTGRLSGYDVMNIQIPPKYAEQLHELKISSKELKEMSDRQVYEHLKKIFSVFDGDPQQLELFSAVCMGKNYGPLYRIWEGSRLYALRRWWIRDISKRIGDRNRHTKLLTLGWKLGLIQITNFVASTVGETIKSLPEPLGNTIRLFNNLSTAVTKEIDKMGDSMGGVQQENPLSEYSEQLKELSEIYEGSGRRGSLLNIISGGKVKHADESLDHGVERAQDIEQKMEQFNGFIENIQSLQGRFDEVSAMTMTELENFRYWLTTTNITDIVDYSTTGLDFFTLVVIGRTVLKIKFRDQHKMREISPEKVKSYFKNAVIMAITLAAISYLLKERQLKSYSKRLQKNILEEIENINKRIEKYTKELQEDSQ